MSSTRTYVVVSRIRYGGQEYEPGALVTMPTDLAAPLLALGRIADEKAVTGLTEETVQKMGEEYVARAKADVEEAQKLREAAADDAFKAATDRDLAEKTVAEAKALAEAAATDRAAAEKALAEAKTLADKAAADRKAAEKAANKK